jgi:hypothetical protein
MLMPGWLAIIQITSRDKLKVPLGARSLTRVVGIIPSITHWRRMIDPSIQLVPGWCVGIIPRSLTHWRMITACCYRILLFFAEDCLQSLALDKYVLFLGTFRRNFGGKFHFWA